MNKYKYTLTIIILFSSLVLQGQDRYTAKRVHFSTDRYDEFSPVIDRDKIVFCSNQENELFLTYTNKDKKGLFNIFSIPLNDSTESSRPAVFSRNLISPYNDGPATFDTTGSMIIYSRNIDIKSKTKDIFDLNNNLGLYLATLVDGEWTNIEPFKYNNDQYSNTTPFLSPDGKYLYFASDMPGGFGGSDLYRCEYLDANWSEPENLGEVINTKGNEVYPSINSAGELFFTSGYFASNRNRSDDIFRFETRVPQLYNCDTLKENQYCFMFWDEKYPGLDSLPVIYEWEFSDGIKIRGLEVEHCFPGAGNYTAKLNIIDNSTSNTFFTQSSMEFEITDFEQPFISSRDAFLKDEEMEFSGLTSNLPGFSIEEYIWDFGDGDFTSGSTVSHTFSKSGVYGVKLGVTGYNEANVTKETRCVIKPVAIVSDNQALAMHLSGIKSLVTDELVVGKSDTNKIRQDFSLFDVNPEEEAFRVEVLSSEERIMFIDSIFDPLRGVYEIKEYYLVNDSLYSYTVGEYSSLLSTYEVYSDVVDRGYTSAKVKTFMLAELPTEIVARINRDFAELSDANFEFNQSMVSESSSPLLDKIVKILEDNPDLAMEIAAHTDNIGSFEYNMELSQSRAQSIVDYLVSKGIEKNRLVGKGYGESRPISANSTEDGRMKNRRVEFLILNFEK
ncbi:MAG TPA: PKD domain-containing protein [Bacteroidales bacterium]|nr:PKD domain-containing protein [Bacteroidales bacterium]